MPIAIRQWDGSKISEPGIYAGVPMDAYHGDLCVGPSISSSGLRTIDSESPLHFFDASYLNPDREEEEPADHYTIGTAVHTLLMRESGFAERFIVRPAQWKDWRTNEAKDWRKAAIAEAMEAKAGRAETPSGKLRRGRPMPGSKASGIKRKFDGRVERREMPR